jgi:uncharacterized protein (DUF302 family)
MMSQSEVTTIPSKHSVSITLDRLASMAVSKGLLIFVRIDHGQNAIDAGMPLRPTQLLIFGNPKGGTPLMQDRQITGSTCRSTRWLGRTKRSMFGSAIILPR